MRVVHLSDIHFDKAGIEDLQAFLIPAIIHDLQIFNSRKTIDLVVIW